MRTIYNFKPKESSYDPLERCETELPKIKKFWDGENKGDYSFPEYTDERIEELEGIVKNSDEIRAAVRGMMIIRELSVLHFTKKLQLDHILNLCSNGERMHKLFEYMDKLTDKEYWQQLGMSYTLQDYNSVPYIFLERMFNINRSDKDYLMDDAERNLLESLPKTVTIYRAMSVEEADSGDYRLSWTMDKEVAENFLERNETIYDTEMTIKELTIPKEKITAIFLGRSESEVIYLN